MSTSLRNLSLLGTLLCLGMASFAEAQRTPQETAARHALRGPEIKKLKVNGHEFNVKQASIRSTRGRTVIKGQLSHHLSFRPDDQVYYTIVKSDGMVTNMDLKIGRGGIAPLASKLAAKFVGKSIAQRQLNSLIQQMGRQLDGNWESAAELIVATIALRAPESGGVGQRSTGRNDSDRRRDRRSTRAVRDYRRR